MPNPTVAPLLLSLLLHAAPDASKKPDLRTESEKSGFRLTGRYDEVISLCAKLQEAHPGKIRCQEFGKSGEGRPLVALIASGDGTFDAKANREKGRPVLFAHGAIHAGEVDGKDAGFLLLREWLEGKLPAALFEKVTFLFVPVVNPDGHERFSAHGRPNQNGPREMGWRVTGQNLNMNRDFAKADAVESQATIALLSAFDPILYLDLHVTDGAKFQHDVALLQEPLHGGPDGMRAPGKGIRDGVFKRLEAQGHLPLPFYPSLLREDDPTSGFALGIAPPRFSNSYWAHRNRYGILVETHSWRPYPHRVKTTRDVLLAYAEECAASCAGLRKAAADADAADAAGKTVEVVLSYKHTEKARPFDFKGYAYTREPSAVSGKLWTRYDEKKPQLWKLPYFDELQPAQKATLPKGGFVIPPAHAAWLGKKLALHGFTFLPLDADRPNTAVQTFRPASVKFGERSYEGRQTLDAKGEWKAETRTLPKGSLFVPAAQPGARLLSHLFEPAARDSFLAWGFFNAHFEQKEYMEDYVAEEVARSLMAANPSLEAEFEKRLGEDEAFRKDASARLRFFYERHPSFDERLELYPVFRIDQTP